MIDGNDLEALRERVLAASGADYGLDRDITRYFRSRDNDNPAFDTIRSLTASIDAALALVEQMLPGWDYGTDLFHDEGRNVRTFSAYVGSPAKSGRDHYAYPRRAASLPLAILGAMLSALINENEIATA